MSILRKKGPICNVSLPILCFIRKPLLGWCLTHFNCSPTYTPVCHSKSARPTNKLFSYGRNPDFFFYLAGDAPAAKSHILLKRHGTYFLEVWKGPGKNAYVLRISFLARHNMSLPPSLMQNFGRDQKSKGLILPYYQTIAYLNQLLCIPKKSAEWVQTIPNNLHCVLHF